MHPRARIAGITVIERDGGLLIHDTERHVEHHLHPLTAFVWKHADGQSTVPEITARVRAVLGDDVTEPHVWAAIDVLTGARLLEGRVAPPAGVERFNRRDLLRQVAVGTVAAAAVGAVMVPEASAADKKKYKGAAAQAQESASKVAAEHAQKAQKAAELKQKKAHHSGHGRRMVLAEGWSDAGGDFQGATFSDTADLVVLGGLVQPGTGATPHVATLPRQARPARALVFPCYAFSSAGDGVARVDVLPDGRIFLVGGLGTMLYLSLAGVVFRSAKPKHGGGDPGDGASEQESKDAVAQEEASKAQEQDDKQTEQDDKQAEQDAKQQAEQDAKQQAEQQAKQQQAEQDQKALQEQKAKKAAEQQQKQQAAEQEQKQQAEQDQKQQAEQQAKQAAEQDAKKQAEQQAKQQAKQQAEQDQKQQEQQSKQQAEQDQKAQQREQNLKQAAEQNQKQHAAEQNQKQQAEQQAKSGG